jgi:hypothetical protein
MAVGVPGPQKRRGKTKHPAGVRRPSAKKPTSPPTAIAASAATELTAPRLRRDLRSMKTRWKEPPQEVEVMHRQVDEIFAIASGLAEFLPLVIGPEPQAGDSLVSVVGADVRIIFEKPLNTSRWNTSFAALVLAGAGLFHVSGAGDVILQVRRLWPASPVPDFTQKTR